MMQLVCVAASTDRGVQLHRDAWPINAHYWLDTSLYAPGVLHFSAFRCMGFEYLPLLVTSRPYLVKVSQIGLNSILVSWTYRPYWPPVAGFNIFYNQQNGGDNGSVAVEKNNVDTAITGLIALATYSINVVAIPTTLPGPSSTSTIIALGILMPQEHY